MDTRSRSRRGATLVLVAIFAVVLIGVGAFAVDFGRLYAFKAQLQSASDAIALAAIIEVKDGRPGNATTLALQYAPRNQVEKQTPVVAAGNIEPGTFAVGGSFTPNGGNWADPNLNAVRVTATHPTNYTLARVMGQVNTTITTVSVAAKGYAAVTDCLKPFGVGYQSLLDALYPPAGSKNVSYDLTAADINTLTGMAWPANAVTILASSANNTAPGNIQAVQVNNPWNGNNAYKNAIIGACTNMPIGPGTWLMSDPGQGSGQTGNALKTFCQNNGGITAQGQNFTCNTNPKVKLALWDINNGLSGANLQYRVKYVGVFAVHGFTKGVGSGNPPDQITGYFTSMAVMGGFTTNPSPLTGTVALVQ